MTTVHYEPERLRLCMEGHAASGEAGKDLVCAALSMLMMTLERRMEEQQERMHPSVRRETGSFSIRCRPEKEWESACREGFETVYAGLRLLAEERSDCVRIR